MADAEQGCVCVDGMRAVTDVWARQEAGLPRGLWPAEVIADHRRGAHYAEHERRLDCLGCWVVAGQAQMAAWRADPSRHEPPPGWVLALLDQWSRYTAALNTVFPCPTCRPEQFGRWRHGCYQRGHVPKRCRLCKETAK